MILGIDASNIRAGGGLTHLAEILRVANPVFYGFEQVIIWSGANTLREIDDKDWLSKIYVPYLDKSLPFRLFWQRFILKRLAQRSKCDLLFVPGGSDSSRFFPIVTMSQNLLPFEWREFVRFGLSFLTVKFILLRWSQGLTFHKAVGVIFLTKYARDAVLRVTGVLSSRCTVIPHGINPKFRLLPRVQRLPNSFTDVRPCKVLYVSIIDVYKHQWHVVDAIAKLRGLGISIVLELVGPSAGGIRRLKETIRRVDPEGSFVTYRGAVAYDRLERHYAEADICVFASSCETFGQILTEAMNAGLPIACSNRSAMPEILGEAGVYFDPENSGDIARALRELIDFPDLRTKLAQAAFDKAQMYSWERCANETFCFIADVAKR